MSRKPSSSASAGASLRTFGRMIRLGMPRWLLCLLGTGLIGVGSYGANLVAGALLSTSLNRLTAGQSPLTDVLGLLGALGGATLVFLLGYLVNLNAAMGIRARIQRRLVSVWVRLTEPFASRRNSAEAMTLVTSDMDVVEDVYFQGLMSVFLIPFFTGVVSLITVAAVDVRLLLPPLVTGGLSLLFSLRLAGPLHAKTRAVRRENDRLTQAFSDLTAGNTAYRAMGATDALLSRYAARSDDYAALNARAKNLKVHATSFSQLMTTLSGVLYFGVGLWLAGRGEVDFSLVLLLFAVQSGVPTMITSLGEAWNFIISASASGERILTSLEWPQEVSQSGDKPQEAGELNLEHITFGYDEGKHVLRDFNLRVAPGKKVALVGSSGSGKSTVLQLLLRFYEPDGGTISLGGVPAQNCSTADWRAAFVLLQQEAPLLTKTIGENIAMGRYGDGVTPTAEEMITAAKAAGIHDFISTLPEGYNTVVADGGKNLSGGQRQRIAIARAFLSHAPIVLLDEPTAALDSESEALVRESLNSLMATRTVVMVAHRLETVGDFDEILLLDGGEVAERGTHAALMAREGRYAALYRAQE